MEIFTCRICGEVYLGVDKPSTCPFCGVSNSYLILARDWTDDNSVELSDVSKENLLTALELELSNTAFYECIAKTVKDVEISLMFKGLAKVEKEHASVFRKILKPDKDPEIKEVCVKDVVASLKGSYSREENAVQFYNKMIVQAEEPRVKEVVGAIMNTEKDHLGLDRKILEERLK